MTDDDRRPPVNRILEALQNANPNYPMALILIATEPDTPGGFRVTSFAHGLGKRRAAHIARQLAREWQAEADAEDERVRLN
jgi:hypothetical protein